jgi:hypothetical protein
MTNTSTPAPGAHTTRRNLLIAAPAIAAFAAVPVLATDHDTDIIAAWRTRKAAYARYNALPMADEPGYLTSSEIAEWAIIDKAEAVIRTTIAKTPRGVAVQLWVAFQHRMTDRSDDAAAQSANLAYFADDSDQDWTERMALAALRSLAAQGAVL